MTLTHEFSRRYENLPVLIYEGQDEACHYLANNILDALKEKEARGEKLVLALSANSALIGLFENFASLYKTVSVLKMLLFLG